MKICKQIGCGRKHYAKGLCRHHYDLQPERKKASAKHNTAWRKKVGWEAKQARKPRRRFTHARNRAIRDKHLTWTLAFEAYEALIKLPCFYCKGSLNETGVGLDRLDNRIGYEPGNVAPCCGDCNLKKGHLEGAGFVYPRTVELMKELVK